VSERERQLTLCAKLRALLGDGEWHLSTELARDNGHRFGDRVMKVRRGDDGGPAWFIEEETVSELDSSIHRYRFTGINPDPPKAGVSWRARALAAEREVVTLRADLAKLRAQLRRHTGQRSLFEEDV
jgi:hypothetical protein